MGIDRLKLVGAIKTSGLVIYLIYFSISNMGLNEFDFVLRPDAELKRELLSSKCLLLLGGSNVRMGLSAEAFSSKSCETLNLGISGESGEFKKYLNWLNHNTSANKVIYSPALIWRDRPLINDVAEAEIKLPATSLLSTIYAAFLFNKDSSSPKFNNFGDQIEYQCPSNFIEFRLKADDFIGSSYFIGREIYRRVSKLKEITNADEIFVRVPPVYVKTEGQAELYKSLMDERVEILRRLGVKIISSTTVSRDGSLFCDSFHPNAKGRKAFTKEIVFLQSIPDDSRISSRH